MKILLLLLLGCASKSSDPPPLPDFGDEGDQDTDLGGDTADTAGPEPDFCDDAPVLTWNNFGQGFITEACQGCHAGDTPDRYGAPEDVLFDTVAQAWDRADRILARASGDYPSMPPLGGTNADDRLRLEYWLRCADPGS
jgi:hypothetical protein